MSMQIISNHRYNQFIRILKFLKILKFLSSIFCSNKQQTQNLDKSVFFYTFVNL